MLVKFQEYNLIYMSNISHNFQLIISCRIISPCLPGHKLSGILFRIIKGKNINPFFLFLPTELVSDYRDFFASVNWLLNSKQTQTHTHRKTHRGIHAHRHTHKDTILSIKTFSFLFFNYLDTSKHNCSFSSLLFINVGKKFFRC